MASSDSKRALKKKLSKQGPTRAADEESKLKGGSSIKRSRQRWGGGSSEGTVNGSYRSKWGSNEWSDDDDDVDIVEVSAPEKAKKMKKKRDEFRRESESDEELLKLRKVSDKADEKVNDDDADVLKVPAPEKAKKTKKKRDIYRGESESDEELKVRKVSDEANEKVDVEAAKKGKGKAESASRKCDKMKDCKREDIPVTCLSWRLRSWDKDKDRVDYTPFYRTVRDRSNPRAAVVADEISDSESVSESSSSSESFDTKESESESDSDSDSESNSDSDSVTRPSLLESDDDNGVEKGENKKKYEGSAFGTKKALSKKKSGKKKKKRAAEKVSSSEDKDSEEVPILERNKKIMKKSVHGEGCSRAARLAKKDKEVVPVAELIISSSSDEAIQTVKKAAKKMRREKQRKERKTRIGEPKRSKKKKAENKTAKNDILDFIMAMIDGKTDDDDDDEGILESSESEVRRASPQELPLMFDWSDDDESAAEKSEFEEFVDELWQDYDNALAYEEVGTYNPHQERERDAADIATNNNYCADGKHDMYLDEQIGFLCRNCSYVETEIRHIMPVFAPKGRTALGAQNRVTACDLLNHTDLHREKENNDTYTYGQQPLCEKTGTVWDLIPGVINTMYPHQRDAFEFMWRNLTGGIEIANLTEAAESDNLGGCVISHAPGTGKTRLAIVFIQSYVKAFPNCNPVVFAPAGIMQTWENEFRKWEFGLPFHNMNSEEFTGKEDERVLEMTRGEPRTMQLARVVKLCSWARQAQAKQAGRQTSVLGMSYDLFREYVLGKSSADSKERELLLTKPGLIVLDEGHTPRNASSRLWKAFNEVKTEKRIILSGTPFQNTFLELRNTLCLVRPQFAQRFVLPALETPERANEKKKPVQDIWNKPTKNVTNENADEVRAVLKPFVHVHSGDILKSLPGLRECVIMLNPEKVQKESIEKLGLVKNSGTFDSEYKISIASIHPYLLTTINKITDQETALLNMDLLKMLRRDPYAGAKTKFVVEFVRLLNSDLKKERVLIFSQYIEPLNLIKKHLITMFQWTEGIEVLQIYGKILGNERQRYINSFNDVTNKARVLLASTRACAEGISLTGASRVVMLDVVWNPAVGKQAISRAFRIGQARVVYTYNLITAGTGEMEKYDVQGKKEELAKLVFSPEEVSPETGRREGDARMLVAEDRILGNLMASEKLKGMFVKICYNKSDDLMERY